MARTISNLELFLGIGLIIVGVVLIVTQFRIPFVAEAIGVALIGIAAYFLYRQRLRIPSLGILLLGVLLLLAHLFEDFGEAANQVLSIAIGVLVGLLGVFVLLGKLRPKDKAKSADTDDAEAA